MSAWGSYVEADGSTFTKWYRETDPWTWFPTGTGRAYGCVAIKRELKRQGYVAAGFVTESTVIGSSATKAIKQFQAARGLTMDGIVGPRTTEALFRMLIGSAEQANGVPDRLAARVIHLESAEDPGAWGWTDPDDKGLAQINVRVRNVPLDSAYDPNFAASYLAGDLRNVYNALRDWDAAVAAWNVGLYWATKWLDAGKPDHGAYDTKNQVDWFTRAYNYVHLVSGQVLSF